MIKEAIEKILELAIPAVIDVTSERKYSPHQLRPITPPVPHPLGMSTLTGIIDWLMTGDVEEPPMIHVISPTKVEVTSYLDRIWEQRKIFITSEPFRRSQFEFGRYMSIEKFIINFQISFEETPTKTKLIQYLSNIRGELVSASVDDGIAQEVAVADKVGRLTEVKLDPIVHLAPFRTFPEIKQPESSFLLRLKAQQGELPVVALYEADGEAWKNDAIIRIGEWFTKQKIVKQDGIPVLK